MTIINKGQNPMNSKRRLDDEERTDDISPKMVEWLRDHKDRWIREFISSESIVGIILQNWLLRTTESFEYEILRVRDLHDVKALNLHDDQSIQRQILDEIITLKENYRNDRIVIRKAQLSTLHLSSLDISSYSMKLRKYNSQQDTDISPNGNIKIGGFEISPYGIEIIPDSLSSLSKSPSVPTSPTSKKMSNTDDIIIHLDSIGKGGSSVVKRGLHLRTMTMVAVKVVQVENPSIRKQMISELRALYSISRHFFQTTKDSVHSSSISSESFYIKDTVSETCPKTTEFSYENENNSYTMIVSVKVSVLAATLIITIYYIWCQNNVGAIKLLSIFILIAFICYLLLIINKNTDDFLADISNFDDFDSSNIESTELTDFKSNNDSNCSKDTLAAVDEFSSCPYIVKFYDACTDPGDRSVCIILELMEGGSFQDVIDAKIRLTENDIAVIAYSIGIALMELHSRKIIHRDVKPGNILFNRKGHVKLSDFGIVREMCDQIGTDTFTGTVRYMSPERIDGEKYSYKSDIWSMGLTLLAIARATSPFSEVGGYWELAGAIKETPTENLVSSELSCDLQDFISRCLRRSPSDRPSAEALMQHNFLSSAKLRGIICPSQQPQIHGVCIQFNEPKAIEVIDKLLEWHIAHIEDAEFVELVIDILNERKVRAFRYHPSQEIRLFGKLYDLWCPDDKLKDLADQLLCNLTDLEKYATEKISVIHETVIAMVKEISVGVDESSKHCLKKCFLKEFKSDYSSFISSKLLNSVNSTVIINKLEAMMDQVVNTLRVTKPSCKAFRTYEVNGRYPAEQNILTNLKFNCNMRSDVESGDVTPIASYSYQRDFGINFDLVKNSLLEHFTKSDSTDSILNDDSSPSQCLNQPSSPLPKVVESDLKCCRYES